MTLSLPDVTLCSVSSINHELTIWAMKKCLAQCTFGDVVFITDRPVEAPFRVEVLPPFAGIDYATTVCRELTKYTTRPFNLLVQYDSYVIEPRAWSDKFYDYDYIGAKWPWQPANYRVGNSGFCLRSKKLLDIMATMELPPHGTFVDDTLVAHKSRAFLEKNHNIKIAPEEIADQFAYERHTPDQPTFGFHGMFNYWRHCSDQDMEYILMHMSDVFVPYRAFSEVIFQLHASRRFCPFHVWYQRLRKHVGTEKMKEHLLQFVKDVSFLDVLIASGEALKNFYKDSQT